MDYFIFLSTTRVKKLKMSSPSLMSGTQNRSSSNPANCFQSFLLLPAELRIRIYVLSLLPRNVDFIICGWEDKMHSDDFISDVVLKPRTPVPAILHVSQESRAECVKYYTILHRANLPLPLGYFNFNLDTLFIGKRSSRDQKYVGCLATTTPYSNMVFLRLFYDGYYGPTEYAELRRISRHINPDQLGLIKRVGVPFELIFHGYDLSTEYLISSMRGVIEITFLWDRLFLNSILVSDTKLQLRANAHDTLLRCPSWVEPKWEFYCLS